MTTPHPHWGAPLLALTLAAGHAGPAVADIALGRDLYARHCAACHGANLEGQPDWQRRGPDGRFPAPPHDETGHTWHHGDAMLLEYTRLGGQAYLDARGIRFDSGMPAFGETLTEAEIVAILAFIRSTWPAQLQAFQAQRTAAERAD